MSAIMESVGGCCRQVAQLFGEGHVRCLATSQRASVSGSAALVSGSGGSAETTKLHARIIGTSWAAWPCSKLADDCAPQSVYGTAPRIGRGKMAMASESDCVGNRPETAAAAARLLQLDARKGRDDKITSPACSISKTRRRQTRSDLAPLRLLPFSSRRHLADVYRLGVPILNTSLRGTHRTAVCRATAIRNAGEQITPKESGDDGELSRKKDKDTGDGDGDGFSPLAPAGFDDRVIKFCSQCGSPTIRQIPRGADDTHLRDVCSSPPCSFVHYTSPKVVVGAVCLWEEKVLLCRRGIEPCKGLWGFPQGYLELGESSREGAVREVAEESGADVEVGHVLAVYNVPNLVQIIYLARLKSPRVEAGLESLEAKLFSWDEIPFTELAFPTVTWALEYAKKIRELNLNSFPPQQRTKIFGKSGPPSGSFVENV